MKKVTISVCLLLALIIGLNPLTSLASASSTVKTLGKTTIKKSTAVKSAKKKKAKKAVKKKKVVKKKAQKLDLNPPLIDPNNPPSSSKPAGQ